MTRKLPASDNSRCSMPVLRQCRGWMLLLLAFSFLALFPGVTAGAPLLTFSPSSGPAGSNVVLTGSSFATGNAVTPYFGGTPYSCNEGAVTVAGGAFTCTVAVPAVSTGSIYSIGAHTAADGNILSSSEFLVTGNSVPRVYVSCAPLSGASATCAATVNADSGSEPTPTGTVALATSSAGTFTGTGAGSGTGAFTCTLASGSCTFTYADTAPGAEMTAAYSGDSIYAPSTAHYYTISGAGSATPVASVSCLPFQSGLQSTTCTANLEAAGGTNPSPSGIASFATSDSGSFSSPSCALAGYWNGNYFDACSVTYTDPSAGDPEAGPTITLSYSGDSNFAAGAGTTTVALFSAVVSETPVNTTLDVGQAVVYNAVVTGGSGTFTANLIDVSSGNVLATATGLVAGEATQNIEGPGALAFVGGSKVYVANNSGNTIDVMSVASNSMVGMIDVGASPSAIAVSPDNSIAYVANSGSNTISVISTASDAVVNTISVGHDPTGVAFSPTGRFAYVTNGGDSTVSVITVASNTVTKVISSGLGSQPQSVAFSPNGGFAYVVNGASVSISVISAASNSVVSTIYGITDVYPGAIAFDPDQSLYPQAYLADDYSSMTVKVVSTATNQIIGNLPYSFCWPHALAFNPTGSTTYVVTGCSDGGSSNAGSIVVVDVASGDIVTTIPVGNIGSSPQGVAFSPDGATAYVSNYQDNTVDVIDVASNSVVHTISSPSNSAFLAYRTTSTTPDTFNVVSTDTEATPPFLFGSAPNTLTIYPAPAVSITPVNTTLDVGQVVTYNAVVTGGSGSFSVELTDTDGDMLATNTITPPADSALLSYWTSSTTPNAFSVRATDTGTTTPFVFSSSPNTIAISTAAATLTLSSSAVDAGQAVTLSANVTGGSGSFTYQFYDENSRAPIPGCSGTYTGPYVECAGLTPTTSTAYNVTVTDTSTTSTFKFGSSSGYVTVNPALVAGAITPATPSVAGGSSVTLTAHPSGGTFLFESALKAVLGGVLSHPQGMAFSHDNGLIYVVDYEYGSSISVLNASTGSIINTLNDSGNGLGTWGEGLENMAFSPNGNTIYATDNEGCGIQEINTSTGNIVTEWYIDYAPYGIAVSPDGNTLYVSLTGSGSECDSSEEGIEMLDASTGNPVGSILNVGSHPQGMAISPDGNTLYVADDDDGSVYPIDVPSWSVTTANIVSGFENPSGITISPDGSALYVSDDGFDTVYEVSASGSPINSFDEGVSDPKGVLISPNGNTLYVANHYDNDISVIDTNALSSVTYPAQGFDEPQGMAISPDGNTIYVANYKSPSISVLDASSGSVIGTLDNSGAGLGGTPGWDNGDDGLTGLAVSPDGNTIYATVELSGPGDGVQVIDASTGNIINTLYTFDASDNPANPLGIAVSPDGNTLYVSFSSGDYDTGVPSIQAIDPSTGDQVGNAITGFDYPYAMAISSNGNTLYVADEYDDVVYVVNVSSGDTIGTISSSDPYGITISKDGSALYVSNSDGTVEAVNASTEEIIGWISDVGLNTPKGIAVTPGGTLYVANHNTNLVSRIGVSDSYAYTYQWSANPDCSSPIGGQTSRNYTATASATYYYLLTDNNVDPAFSVCSAGDTVTVGSGGSTTTTTIPPTTTTIPLSHIMNITGGTAGDTVTVGSGGSTTTTTIPPTTTTIPLSHIINITSGTALAVGTSSSPVVVGLKGTPDTFSFTSNSPGNETITITNITSAKMTELSNQSKLAVFNVSIKGSGPKRTTTVHMSLAYDCAIPGGDIAPYLMQNGTWVPITPFTVDPAACKVSFAVTVDPIVGLFQNTHPATTAQPIATLQTTTVPSELQYGGYAAWSAAAAAVLIIVAAAVLAYRMRRAGVRGGRGK